MLEQHAGMHVRQCAVQHWGIGIRFPFEEICGHLAKVPLWEPQFKSSYVT